MPSPNDPYSRLQYRRLIAWPGRIQREWPLLEAVLGPSPRRVLDLGCGTGEHSRFLAEQGYDVVGVDRSSAQLEEARSGGDDGPARPPGGIEGGVHWLEADLGALADVDVLEPGSFDGAICLGNTLPHLDALEGFVGGVHRLLRPGAALLLQILNYERIFNGNVRHLPVNVRPAPEEDGGEIVFLRLMELHDDGTVTFCPTTLAFDPEQEEPVRVKSTRRVRLRGWKRPELEAAFKAAGFEVEAFGSVERSAYEAEASSDLVLVARR